MVLASVLIKSAVAALSFASVFSNQICDPGTTGSSCTTGAGLEWGTELQMDGDSDAHLMMLQRRAQATAGAEADEDQGPLARWEERLKAQEAQQQEQQPQQQPQQQQSQGQGGSGSSGGGGGGSAPMIMEAINGFLAENVTNKLKEILPLVIKTRGYDPVSTLVEKTNLNIKELTGMSSIEVKSFKLIDIEILLNNSGLGGSATFALVAEIPQMKAQVSRVGNFGLEQAYTLSIPGTGVAISLTGHVALQDGKIGIESVSPMASITLPQMSVTGDGVNEDVATIQQKMSVKIGAALSKAFEKMLPMSMNMTLHA